jgi:UDP-N-acetylmuramate--alanine ligase
MLDKQNIYFVGIGGIGMSALARYFNSIGKNVAGYDRFRSIICEQLEADGISIHYEDNLEMIAKDFRKKADTLVIYTPAIPDNHTELQYFQKREFDCIKRAQVLGLISNQHRCLAVAGTHGKTTTSALLTYIFRNAGIQVTAFLGGIATNYKTNFLAGEGTDLLIAEADEFDRSFLQLNPSGAIITSMDADHLDIYEDEEDLKNTFKAFAQKVKQHRIVCSGLEVEGKTYSTDRAADFKAENIKVADHTYQFDLVTPNETIPKIKSGLPGRHNVENAIGAAALALQYGVSTLDVKNGIENFKGVKRRFEYHIKTEKLVYIDDYAHHPSEIDALIRSVRELYPNKSITGIFQPHLYSRTKDFMDDFAKSLSQLDKLILLDIYPAREKPIPGITSEALLNKIELASKTIVPKQELITHLKERKNEIVLTIGAGDIDQWITPIKMVLLNG